MKTNKMKYAHETYTERRKAIDVKIAKLQTLLREQDTAEAATPSNWGFAGSAGHINEKLDELIAFLGGEEN